MEFIHNLKTSAFDNLSVDGYVEDIRGWMDVTFSDVIRNKLMARDRNKLRHAMTNAGLEEVRFKFDFEGAKVVMSS
jgi:hypothetical protein